MRSVDDTIEDVIRQFADPLALFRELIQNAIDAGTGEVEISFDYDVRERMATIQIADWGEGMTREIVETRLVRLFSSHKDDDYTKIGKFGIGFVSVFALEPHLVCVDTGKDGEYLRVLFHPDRSYELLQLEQPVEGTTVRIMKKLSRGELDDLRDRARDAVSRWCRFVDIPVIVEGEDLRQPFDLEGLVVARFEEEGTRAVAALRPQMNCNGAYYHSGLALQWTRSPWPHVEFMIDSRYLKHTLTRDQVIEDKNFHAAMKRLETLVKVTLQNRTAEALGRWCTDPDRRWDWLQLCSIVDKFPEKEWIRGIRFPTLRGGAVSIEDCRRAAKSDCLFVSHGHPHFASWMPERYVILDVRPDSAAIRVVAKQLTRAPGVLEDEWVHIPATDRSHVAGATELRDCFERLLRHAGATPHSVSYGEFEYPYSRLEDQCAIVLPASHAPVRRGDVRSLNPQRASGAVFLDPDHEIVARAIEVAAAGEPEWAAYTLLKICALDVGAVETRLFDESIDVSVADRATQIRRQRRRSR